MTWRDLTPLAVAVVAMVGAAVRIAQGSELDGVALLAAGLIVLGYWLAHQ